MTQAIISESDPTLVKLSCDIFITKPFWLAVFRHPDPQDEIKRLLKVARAVS